MRSGRLETFLEKLHRSLLIVQVLILGFAMRGQAVTFKIQL